MKYMYLFIGNLKHFLNTLNVFKNLSSTVYDLFVTKSKLADEVEKVLRIFMINDSLLNSYLALLTDRE